MVQVSRRFAAVVGHAPTVDHGLSLDPFWGRRKFRLAQIISCEFGRLRSI